MECPKNNGLDHEWIESYYGYTCKHCGLFYPYGQAPWEKWIDLDNMEDYRDYNKDDDKDIPPGH